jgi:molecular chaperone GrpE
MSDQERDPKQEAGTSADGPKPAPSGTGPGGGGDRPIPADGVSGGNGNTPDDGATPGDIDADAVDGGAGTAGPSADPRSAEDDVPDVGAAGPEGSAAPTEGAADGTDESASEAVEQPAPEEPDWKDRYVRSVAELDNVRKRARRDAAAGEARGIARLAKELLPALDNLDRALAHVDQAQEQDPAHPAGDTQLVEGVRIVHREIHAALSQAGIEAYDPTGEQFDPHAHEALTQQPAPEGTPSGTILAVYQAGYRRGDDVLRAAKVVVAG